ncbi:MAG: right-handed parallel beta-helix repeat-containing protein [Deltaproteobacteria bacterium]|nr:right-handed parallel beta-helix repeat-containing protein [Deltaproteobacteria bacterium]MBK8714403.1 right-handed parallel beta-helix repeat-containing protein [Deltaproteobacteria bacterium]MBP7289120.1 right-handed parallel beta-helix repeat-containing protein [Nannocystaceae bacterium]
MPRRITTIPFPHLLAVACASDPAGDSAMSDSAVTVSTTGGASDSASSTASTADGSGTLDDSASDPTTATSDDTTTGDAPDECSPPPAEPPCEASGDGRCFYIDPVAGDDTGDGSAASPWRSFVNLNSSIYYGVYPPPAQWTALAPGDVVYVRDGTLTDVFHPGDDSGPEGGGSYVLYLRGVHGEGAPITIKRYPSERPILAPEGDALGVLVAQSSDIVIEGLEVREAHGRGIRIEEAERVDIGSVLVYDTDGVAADNVAGLEILGSGDVVVHDSVFADNYDRTAAAAGTQTENSGNLVLFSNDGAVELRHCAFYQSEGPDSQSSGFGVKYKHASPTPAGTFEVHDCYFEGNVFGVGIGTAHAHVHHNVVVDSAVGISSIDFGGPTHQWDQWIEANTLITTVGIYVSPTLDWQGEGWADLTDNAIERNLVVDTSSDHSGERRTVLFNPYMSDALHDAYAVGVTLAANCYHAESGAASFGFAEAENYGAAGGAFDLAGWRATYGFDLDAVEADPDLTGLVPSAQGPCQAMGAIVGGHMPAVDLADPLACGDAASLRRWE